MSSFTRQLTVLGGGQPRAPRAIPGRTGLTSAGPVPATLAAPITARSSRQRQIRRRRRALLYGLLSAAVFTLGGSVFFGGLLLVAHLVIDAALIFYVVWLVSLQQNAVEASAKVTYINQGPLTPIQQLAGRAASSE
ncbi:MAG: hypothetical protein GY929_25695 [Actinomycetia bacterium]|nr:hypothetical protein [Actinomycetes bacterium]